MDNRYFMIDLPETEDAAYARIAEYCDEVELLSEDHSGGVYDQECLWGTELEPLLPALVGEREGSSWGMHGKLYRFRMTEEVAALLYDIRQEFGKILIFGRRLPRKFAHHAGDGEHRALFRLGNGGIGDLCAVFHRFGERLDRDRVAVFDLRADPAEQLRQNNARIAARPFERALRNGVAQLG